MNKIISFLKSLFTPECVKGDKEIGLYIYDEKSNKKHYHKFFDKCCAFEVRVYLDSLFYSYLAYGIISLLGNDIEVIYAEPSIAFSIFMFLSCFWFPAILGLMFKKYLKNRKLYK